MKLSIEEERMLNGESGPGVQRAMELLVAIGETYGAERMIEVTSAHLVPPDLQFWTVGKLGTWARELVAESVEGAGCFRANTTINPVIFDPNLLRKFGYPQPYVDEMKDSIARGVDLYERLRVIPTYSCCPFFLFPPRMGEHVAMAETTVQIFVNSIFGARTNREGGPSALASALTGRTPFYGMHLSENRFGQVVIKFADGLDPRTFSYADFSALAYHVGGKVAGKIPVYVGLPVDMSMTDLLFLARSHPTTGGLLMFHAVGITPEARTLEAALGGRKPSDVVEVGKKDIQATFHSLCSAKDERIDWVLLGCPHATLEQVKEVAKWLEGKKIREGVKLILATNDPLRSLAQQMGLVRIIEGAGGFVLSGVCSVGFPRRATPPGYNIGVVASDAAGAAHLLKVMGVPVWFGSIERCIKAAIAGRWEADER
jgi:predicted aconitase